MPICPNCGSTLPCTCACSSQTIRIIHDDVDERKIESLMQNALKAEKDNRISDANRYYSEVIREINGDEDYSSKEHEVKQAIKNINNAKNYSDKAWEQYNKFNDEAALALIDTALSYSKNNFNDWNRKGLILHHLKRFRESEECYDKSLNLSMDEVVLKNKADMLYEWAGVFKKSENYVSAIEKINEAFSIYDKNDEYYEKTLKLKIEILTDNKSYLEKLQLFDLAEKIKDEIYSVLTEVVCEDEVIKGKISPQGLDLNNPYENPLLAIDEIIGLFEKRGNGFCNKENLKNYANAFYIKASIFEKNKQYLRAMMYYGKSYHVNYLYYSLLEMKSIMKNVDHMTLKNDISLFKSDPFNQKIKNDDAEMIYDVAFEFNNCKIPEKIPFAVDLAKLGISLLSKTDTEGINKFKQLLDSNKKNKKFLEEYDKAVKRMKTLERKYLITITEIPFRKSDVEFENGMTLELKKEPDNPYDHDAIAVYHNSKLVGYVANSDNIASEMTSKACELKHISDNTTARYLLRYESKHIAEIIHEKSDLYDGAMKYLYEALESNPDDEKVKNIIEDIRKLKEAS